MGSVRQLCQPQKIQSLHPYGLGDFAELAWLQCLWRYAGSGGKAVLWGEVRGGHQANRRPGAGHGTAADVLHTFYPALESNGSHTFLQLAITRLAIRAYAVTFKGGRVGGGSPVRARGTGRAGTRGREGMGGCPPLAPWNGASRIYGQAQQCAVQYDTDVNAHRTAAFFAGRKAAGTLPTVYPAASTLRIHVNPVHVRFPNSTGGNRADRCRRSD